MNADKEKYYQAKIAVLQDLVTALTDSTAQHMALSNELQARLSPPPVDDLEEA